MEEKSSKSSGSQSLKFNLLGASNLLGLLPFGFRTDLPGADLTIFWYCQCPGKAAKEHKSGRQREAQRSKEFGKQIPRLPVLVVSVSILHIQVFIILILIHPTVLASGIASGTTSVGAGSAEELDVIGHATVQAFGFDRWTSSLVPTNCQAAVVVRVPKETFACLKLRNVRMGWFVWVGWIMMNDVQWHFLKLAPLEGRRMISVQLGVVRFRFFCFCCLCNQWSPYQALILATCFCVIWSEPWGNFPICFSLSLCWSQW